MNERTARNDDEVIAVTGLTKRYGARAVVDDVDISVERGRICGFLGPNGSGKTTTLRMLCGLLKPDAGQGRCLGLDLNTHAAAIKRQVGYMTQKFGLYEDLSIRQNLDFVARLFGLPQRRDAVDASLERLGLQTRQHQLAGALSGGWKQRLALAACLIHEPQLLLLDEPTAGVDPRARRDFWDEIHVLASEGVTVLVSTHYMDEAERCHELIYIAYGKILARGTESQIIGEANLQVRAVSGLRDSRAIEALKQAPGILSAAAFGSALHVAAHNRDALDQALTPLLSANPGLHIQDTEANLEDVFISLIAQARDNFAPGDAA